MTQQPETTVQPFTLHLDASDGTSLSGVGVVWPDGAATLYRPTSPSVFPLTARSLEDLLTIFCGSHRHLYRIERAATPAPAEEPKPCGKTVAVGGKTHQPCNRPAGHPEAYCRDASSQDYFLAAQETKPEGQPLAVGDRYESRTRARTVTVTRLWADEYGAEAVAFEWRGGMSGAAHTVDMFHQLYRPAP